MKRTILKVVFSELVKVVTAPIRILPVKRKRILFTGLTGGNGYDYSCNPKYIYEYLRDHYPGQFEYVWAVSDKTKYLFLEEEGVKLIKHFTVSSFPMLLTSKVIVTNGSYVPWFPFRKSQYVINTWHGGGAYKKVELEIDKSDWAAEKMVRFCAKNMNLFLASCKIQEMQMIRKTYRYEGEVLRAGTPRNDQLVLGNVKDMEQRVRSYYHIPEDAKIILYAPTYRNAASPVVLEADRLLAGLEKNQEKWVLLGRYHRYQKDGMHVSISGTRFIDVMDYPDMQELLAAADLLVTDYSSCVWDYAFLERPCFLFVPDQEEYIAKTGFYVGMDQWPFFLVKNMEELLEQIEHIQVDESVREDYKKRLKEHLQTLGSYETGNSREAVAGKILEQTG